MAINKTGFSEDLEGGWAGAGFFDGGGVFCLLESLVFDLVSFCLLFLSI